LVQKYGPIEQFDFLFHRSGPNAGLPRGYAFVEFKDRRSAESCMSALDGKRVLERPLTIRWAYQAVRDYPDEQTKLKSKLPALSVADDEGSASAGPSKLSKDKAINAIEAKLRAMDREKNQANFSVLTNKGGAATSSSPKIRPYAYSNNNNKPVSYRGGMQSQLHHGSHRHTTDRTKKPYTR